MIYLKTADTNNSKSRDKALDALNAGNSKVLDVASSLASGYITGIGNEGMIDKVAAATDGNPDAFSAGLQAVFGGSKGSAAGAGAGKTTDPKKDSSGATSGTNAGAGMDNTQQPASNPQAGSNPKA